MFIIVNFTLLNNFNYIYWTFLVILVYFNQDLIKPRLGLFLQKNESFLYFNYIVILFLKNILLLNLITLLPFSIFWVLILELSFFCTIYLWRSLCFTKVIKISGLFLKMVSTSSINIIFCLFESFTHIVSFLVRPFSLFLRIFSNLFSNHLLLTFLPSVIIVMLFIRWDFIILLVQVGVYGFLIIFYKRDLLFYSIINTLDLKSKNFEHKLIYCNNNHYNY